MGIQAAGKSTVVKSYVAMGYKRLNRDDMGGSLEQLNKKLEEMIKAGEEKFVLDNTYGTKENRKPVLDIGKKYGYHVKCIWITTKIEDAQYNAASRILDRYYFGQPKPIFTKINELLGPNGYKLDKDPCNIPSIALYAYKKSFEEPTMEEGFSIVLKQEFKRLPLPKEYVNKALILDYDDTLRKTKNGGRYPKSPSEIEILPNRREVIAKYVKQGYKLLGVSNQSGIEKGDLSEAGAIACFKKTNELLGFDIDFQFCPHHSFPIRCFCRKPLPGLGVFLIKKHLIIPSESFFVGDAKSDKTFAARCGFKYATPDEFFK